MTPTMLTDSNGADRMARRHKKNKKKTYRPAQRESLKITRLRQSLGRSEQERKILYESIKNEINRNRPRVDRRRFDRLRVLKGFDRRNWRPDTAKFTVHRLDGRAAQTKRYRRPRTHIRSVVDRDRFIDPLRVAVCIRRRIRRNILFKIAKAGKGKAGPKKKILNWTSHIKC